MATDSLTHNFILDTASAERFVNALYESKLNHTPLAPVPAKFLTDKNEISEFMKKLKTSRNID